MLSFLLISTQQKTTGEQNLRRGTPVDNYIITKDNQKINKNIANIQFRDNIEIRNCILKAK